MDQVQVVAEARPAEFVGTQRLDEKAVGCAWRNIFQGGFRFALRASPDPPLSHPALSKFAEGHRG